MLYQETWEFAIYADWAHRRSCHCLAQVRWRIVRDAGIPLTYYDLVNAVTACPVCSKNVQSNHQRSLGPFSRVPKWWVPTLIILSPPYLALTCLSCVGTASDPTQASPGHCANQAAIIEKLSNKHGYSRHLNSDWRPYSKGHDVQGWTK